ncbi:MAG: hypothetical protein FD177_2649 [Desulfovibrionaceae bacterium]|nr:MAG: hypothetical protein FD177_2649 [Desulfovibrionaceae bacterium]
MKRLVIILFVLAAVGLAFGTATRSEATAKNSAQGEAQKYEVQKP